MKAGVLTVSDRVSSGEAEDTSGPRAVEFLTALGFEPELRVVPDGERSVIKGIRDLVDDGAVLAITTGGTGFGPRDLTPEATATLVDRKAPGLSEAMRAATSGDNPHGMLSRGVSGIFGSTLVVNLPGSEKAVAESLAVIGPALEHAVRLLGDEPTHH